MLPARRIRLPRARRIGHRELSRPPRVPLEGQTCTLDPPAPLPRSSHEHHRFGLVRRVGNPPVVVKPIHCHPVEGLPRTRAHHGVRSKIPRHACEGAVLVATVRVHQSSAHPVSVCACADQGRPPSICHAKLTSVHDMTLSDWSLDGRHTRPPNAFWRSLVLSASTEQQGGRQPKLGQQPTCPGAEAERADAQRDDDAGAPGDAAFQLKA